MASFYDTTIGQQIEFQRVLASAGFTDSDIARIIKEPNLASVMFASLQPKTAPSMSTATNIVARVERQLQRYEAAYFIVSDEVRQRILAQAAAFVPLSATDRPLVTGFFDSTPEAFNQVWSKVKLDGYETVRYFNESQPLRFADGMQPANLSPRLVHFDPNTYQGDSPELALKKAKWDKVRLAGIEVAEMLFVEPEWALEWNGKAHPYPNCSALQLGTDWSDVPDLHRWDGYRQLRLRAYGADDRHDDWSDVPDLHRWDGYRQLRLRAYGADDRHDDWSSPSVREC